MTAADGFWQAPSTPRMSSAIAGTDPAAGMQYLQPVLGQAIVQDLLLDREAEAVLSASSMELNRAVVESQAMERHPESLGGRGIAPTDMVTSIIVL